MGFKKAPSQFVKGKELPNPFVVPAAGSLPLPKPKPRPVSNEHLEDLQLFEPRTPCPVRYVSFKCRFPDPELQQDMFWEHHTHQRESNLPRVAPTRPRRRTMDAGAPIPAPQLRPRSAPVFRQTQNERRQLEPWEKERKARQERREAAEQPLVRYSQLERVKAINLRNAGLWEARERQFEVEVDRMTMSESVQDQHLHNQANRRRGRDADGNSTAWRPMRSGLTNSQNYAQHAGYRYSR